MERKAKLFMNGRSQAVRLPAEFRFRGTEVYIRKDTTTGDVILSQRPTSWAGFHAALEGVEIPDDFLDPRDRNQEEPERDPFAGWRE